MKLSYSVFDPTGNITVLVESGVPVSAQPRVASRLMALEPRAEQVGFLSADADGADLALRMAGGEFCGNAAMSAAVSAAEASGVASGEMRVRVSGAAEPVSAAVARQDDGLWRATVDMPQPVSVDRAFLSGAGAVPVVRFPGITHVILTEPMPRPLAEVRARQWCADLGAEALGLMFLRTATAGLTPLVYVPAVDTLCWEGACASGTTAVGAFLASEQGGRVTATLHQSGGSLTIEADPDAGVLRLTGTVRRAHRAEAEIEI